MEHLLVEVAGEVGVVKTFNFSTAVYGQGHDFCPGMRSESKSLRHQKYSNLATGLRSKGSVAGVAGEFKGGELFS